MVKDYVGAIWCHWEPFGDSFYEFFKKLQKIKKRSRKVAEKIIKA